MMPQGFKKYQFTFLPHIFDGKKLFYKDFDLNVFTDTFNWYLKAIGHY